MRGFAETAIAFADVRRRLVRARIMRFGLPSDRGYSPVLLPGLLPGSSNLTVAGSILVFVRIRWSLAALIVITVLTACGFRAGGPAAVEVNIRNLSPGPVVVQISAAPSGTQKHTIQRWHKGQCFAHLGFDPGSVEIRVSGSNVGTERIYSVQVPNNQTMQIGVQVFANGRVQFGGAFPDDILPCEGGGY